MSFFGIDLSPMFGRVLSALDTFIEVVVASCVLLLLLTAAFFISHSLSDHTLWYAGLAVLCLVVPELALALRTQLPAIRRWLGTHRGPATIAEVGPQPVVPNIIPVGLWFVAALLTLVAWHSLVTDATKADSIVTQVHGPKTPTSDVLGSAITPAPTAVAKPSPTPIPAQVRTVEAVRITANRCGENEVTTIEYDLTMPPDQQLKYWLLRSDDAFPTDLFPQGPPSRRRLEKPHLEFNVFTPICGRGYKVSLIECTPEGSAVIEAVVDNSEASLRTPPTGCTDIGQEFKYDGVK